MKIKRIEHIAIAVANLAQISTLLQDTFGLTLEYEEELVQTKLAMLPVGQTYIELLEGLTPQSGASKWIAERGQGLYHICFEVDDIDAALAELKAKNTPLLNDEPMLGHGDCRIAFIDPKATGNILFELAEMPKGGHTGH